MAAIDELGLDELWWLVSPGNPLKPVKGMAPLAARLASARAMSRRSRISPTNIEVRLRTRYTINTVRALIRHYPKRRFVWMMGADIIGEFHRWRDWRKLARLIPIAIVVRPGYEGITDASPAAVWLRRFVRPLSSKTAWTKWRLPALVLLHTSPDPSSATALRRADPDWHLRFSNSPIRPSSPPRRPKATSAMKDAPCPPPPPHNAL